MGLKFCNEAIMSLAQVWPQHCNLEKEPNTPLQVSYIYYYYDDKYSLESSCLLLSKEEYVLKILYNKFVTDIIN